MRVCGRSAFIIIESGDESTHYVIMSGIVYYADFEPDSALLHLQHINQVIMHICFYFHEHAEDAVKMNL